MNTRACASRSCALLTVTRERLRVSAVACDESPLWSVCQTMNASTDPLQVEIDWLRRARQGDSAAFAALYLQHSAAVYTLALRMSGQRSEAEDLTQETFLRALQSLSSAREGVSLGPWLKRIAANLAIDRQRRLRPGGELEEDWCDGCAVAPGETLDLIDALARLDPIARSVVWLALVEGWTHRELADRYSRSESWSKSVLARAFARLKLEHSA